MNNIAHDILDAPGFRWLPGMKLTHEGDSWRYHGPSYDYPIGEFIHASGQRAVFSALDDPGFQLDLTDPATIGCLAHLAFGEVNGDVVGEEIARVLFVRKAA